MKKKVLLLVGLMLCLLLVGCGNAKTKNPKDVIPSVSEYFDGADISLITDNEKTVYYMVENYTTDMYNNYLNACKSSIFTDVTYHSETDDGFVYNYINSTDGVYKLTYDINGYNKILSIDCSIIEE